MSLSTGQLAQMEAAAINREKLQKLDLGATNAALAELEVLKGKIERGELAEVCCCRDCRYGDPIYIPGIPKEAQTALYYECRKPCGGYEGMSWKADFYCADGKERKEKTDAEIH